MNVTSDEIVRAQVLRTLPRLTDHQREALRLYLGGADASRDLRDLVLTVPLLRERCDAFLKDHPEALQAFAPPPPPRNRFKPVALIAVAVLLAVVPLAAQYEHQLGMVSGPDQAMPAVALLRPQKPLAAATPRPRKAPARRKTFAPRSPHLAAVPFKRAPVVKRAAVALLPRRAKLHPKRRTSRPHRIAASRRDPIAVRASSVVGTYLDRVIHGDVFDAPENSIVSAMSYTHVLAVRPVQDGREKVDVSISGPRGRYFEVFYVALDTMRIIDRSFVRTR